MTVEEIKETVSIRDVLASYGVNVRRDGMCSCPIHGEKHPSMKVYKDSYNCFACGANGDVLSLVMALDNCDFKTAFYSLGGSYKRTSLKEKRLAELKRKAAKEARQKAENQKKEFKNTMIRSFDLIKDSISNDKPFSDRWCESQNMLPVLTSWWDRYEAGEEIDEVNVYRKCQQFNQRYDSIAGDNS